MIDTSNISKRFFEVGKAILNGFKKKQTNPFQERYDEIITTLKYTKHSKQREKLLKLKMMYEKLL